MSEEKQKFKVTEDHLKLLSNFRVVWNSTHAEVPAFNERSPYGGDDLYKDMLIILGWEIDIMINNEKRPNLFNCEKDQVPVSLKTELFKVYRELEMVLIICLRTMSFEPGVYEADLYGDNWKKL